MKKDNLSDIPRTRSDKTEEHYELKKAAVYWLATQKEVEDYIYVRYDEPMITISKGLKTRFIPDVVIHFVETGKQIWIEAETNPLCVFHKLGELIYLQDEEPENWPRHIQFIIFNNEGIEGYCRSIKRLASLIHKTSVGVLTFDKKTKQVSSTEA